jgi:Flp pilus assembly pilin Flp
VVFLRRARERGQAAVEVALCLPLVALLLATVVEVGAVAGEQVRLWNAARSAARAAVVDPNPASARAAAERIGLEPLDLNVHPDPAARRRGDPLTVLVTYRHHPVVPVLGLVFGGIELSARATMQVEDP